MTRQGSELEQWVEQCLKERNWQYEGALHLDALSGDAGFRRYYRLNAQPALLVVEAPPTTEDSHSFVRIAHFLRDNGVHTPEIIAVDYPRGFLLVEDFGDRLYGEELSPSTVELLYGEALMTLLRMQQSELPEVVEGEAGELIPVYDQPRLRQEMELFRDWFVPKLLGHELTEGEHLLVDQAFGELEQLALQQPQVFVHRDYHSRNLLWREGVAPGVVDFQDAVRGPLTYDLVSLLRDCYIRWPRADVKRWALAYGDMAVDAGLMEPITSEQFLRWFDWMGLQRHIKVLGIFARLSLRDGKHGYLDDLPLVMRYTLEVAEEYPQLSAFVDWFKAVLLPLAQQQPWYKNYCSAGDQTFVEGDAEKPTEQGAR